MEALDRSTDSHSSSAENAFHRRVAQSPIRALASLLLAFQGLSAKSCISTQCSLLRCSPASISQADAGIRRLQFPRMNAIADESMLGRLRERSIEDENLKPSTSEGLPRCVAATEYTLGGKPITVLQNASCGMEDCGSVIWVAGLHLLDWITASPDRKAIYHSRAVLELGAGTGFVGITLASSGAASVLLTDLPQQVPFLQLNIQANAAHTVRASALPWGLDVPQAVMEDSWDLIVGSDIAYDPDLFEPLAATLSALLRARPSSYALLALGDRSDFVNKSSGTIEHDYDIFFDVAAKHGLEATQIGHVPIRPGSIDDFNTDIFSMRHISASAVPIAPAMEH